jgi:hypothetical protein
MQKSNAFRPNLLLKILKILSNLRIGQLTCSLLDDDELAIQERNTVVAERTKKEDTLPQKCRPQNNALYQSSI